MDFVDHIDDCILDYLRNENRLETANAARRPRLELALGENEDDSRSQDADDEELGKDYGGDIRSSSNSEKISWSWTYEDLLSQNKLLENQVCSLQEEIRDLQRRNNAIWAENTGEVWETKLLAEKLKGRQRELEDENQELRKQLRNAQRALTGNGAVLVDIPQNGKSSTFDPAHAKNLQALENQEQPSTLLTLNEMPSNISTGILNLEMNSVSSTPASTAQDQGLPISQGHQASGETLPSMRDHDKEPTFGPSQYTVFDPLSTFRRYDAQRHSQGVENGSLATIQEETSPPNTRGSNPHWDESQPDKRRNSEWQETNLLGPRSTNNLGYHREPPSLLSGSSIDHGHLAPV